MTIRFEAINATVERRRHGRAALNTQVFVRERSRSAMAAQLADLNSFGCRVEGMILVQSGAQVWIRLPGLEGIAVRVAWSEGTCFGLEFETPLHPAVTARFMPAEGSHAAAALRLHASNDEPLLSRREQIMAGIAAADHSPLQRKKRKSGLGLTGRINRAVSRQADTRFEPRFADAVPQGTQLSIGGSAAEVVNVSSSGIRVRTALGEKDIGDELSVEFAGFDPMAGKLVWLSETEAGIALPSQSIDLVDRAAH